MKSKQEIEVRLEDLERMYRVTSDNLDSTLKARIQEINWVLENDENYISHDG